ncbi:PilZ domain-containing protein [Mesoterricola silvestris]|uniref:PilZ domain-containing protein n=1 Tax=Mesoterricola silvestris TaxID=2927979 RepID=A0AA48KC14_9BACT|nr:PilZ domain-containing protein [Mesoterricola silvestris]BDU73028.1 hypothetical protein METEAL_22020 [Mesoterricola silvestris]
MEKRKHSRTALISDYTTQFHLGGKDFNKIQVANIGTHGCCVKLPIGSAQYLKGKPVLENMILLHADSKKYSLKGKVAWHEEPRGQKDAWITAGVEFLETPAECVREISEYVIATVPKGSK